MDEHRARSLLGLSATATPTEARDAYRRRIREAHPDAGGPASGRTAATLNEAYSVLVRARRERSARPPDPVRGSPPGAPPPGRAGPPVAPVPVEVLDGDTLHLDVPADEAFVRLLDACHRIGEVTYVDRSCAILETLVAVPGEGTCSLLITLQGRSHGTEAFCTLEAIERVAQPPVRPVTVALAAALAR